MSSRLLSIDGRVVAEITSPDTAQVVGMRFPVLSWAKPLPPRLPTARERFEAGKRFYGGDPRNQRRDEVADDALDEQAALEAARLEQQRQPRDLISAPVPAPEPPEAAFTQ